MSRQQIVQMLQRQIDQDQRGYSRGRGLAGGLMSGGAVPQQLAAYQMFRAANPGLSREQLRAAWARHKLVSGGWIGEAQDRADPVLARLPSKDRRQRLKEIEKAYMHPTKEAEYKQVAERYLAQAEDKRAKARARRKAAIAAETAAQERVDQRRRQAILDEAARKLAAVEATPTIGTEEELQESFELFGL